MVLLYGIWLAHISVESESPSRVVNTSSLLQVVLTNFLTTGEYCLLVEIDSARTHRESQALTVLMAVVCCTFASAASSAWGCRFMTNIQPLEVLTKALVSRPWVKHTGFVPLVLPRSCSRMLGPELCSSEECTSILCPGYASRR